MRAATIHQIKQELANIPTAELVELCIRLAKYKMENKELLSYLLFEADDEQGYIKLVKQEIDLLFSDLNLSNLYFTKKGLRKIIRIITKHVRYSASKQAEAEWLLYFCMKIKELGIPLHKNLALANLYQAQIKKIDKVTSSMHEDLQYEYKRELEKIR